MKRLPFVAFAVAFVVTAIFSWNIATRPVSPCLFYGTTCGAMVEEPAEITPVANGSGSGTVTSVGVMTSATASQCLVYNPVAQTPEFASCASAGQEAGR